MDFLFLFLNNNKKQVTIYSSVLDSVSASTLASSTLASSTLTSVSSTLVFLGSVVAKPLPFLLLPTGLGF